VTFLPRLTGFLAGLAGNSALTGVATACFNCGAGGTIAGAEDVTASKTTPQRSEAATTMGFLVATVPRLRDCRV